MRKFLLGLGAAAIGFQVSPAAAQSLWTGGYAGVRVGYGYQEDDSDEAILFDRDLDGRFGDTVTTVSGADAFTRGFCGGAVNAGETECRDDNGVNYAIFAGYDMQMANRFVLGVLAEFGRSDVEDSVTAFSSTPASYTLTRRLREFGSIRLRAGYPISRTLLYATGGVAAANVDFRFETTNTTNTFQDIGGGNTQFGYQVGGGVEQRITPRFTVGAQYLFLSLEKETYRVRAGGTQVPVSNPFIRGNALGTDFRRSDRRFKTHDVSIVASYRF